MRYSVVYITICSAHLSFILIGLYNLHIKKSLNLKVTDFI
jgi:hypothetical protein